MKVVFFFTTILLLLSISANSFGQKAVGDENWLKGFKTEADDYQTLSYWDFASFKLEDIPQAKKRLNSVRQYTPQNEWEGVYYSNTDVGDSRFIWNEKGGFFSFHFYHSLKSFYFGKAKDSLGFIELDYEKPPIPQMKRKTASKNRLIKVKIGEKHFLVPETRLRDFCERAAGLSVSFWDFYYYFKKYTDRHIEEFGLPILPAEYKKYFRYPIEAKIIRVGKRKIIPNEQSTKEYNFDDIHYPITINIGKNKNLKKQMNFFVENLGEWIQIEKVYQGISVGFIRRDFDENKQEQCRDSEEGMGQLIPCKEIKIGLIAKTKGSL